VVSRQIEDIADTLHIKDFAMATMATICLSIYGVYIGAIWRIQLNHPYMEAMRPYDKLLSRLVLFWL